MPRKDQKNDKQQKKPAPTKLAPVRGPSAKQRRHERSIAKGAARREGMGVAGEQARAKVKQKAETRRRMKSYTPAVRAEHSAAGREHRKPSK